MNKLKKWYLKKYTDYFELVEDNKTLTEKNEKLNKNIGLLVFEPESVKAKSVEALYRTRKSMEQAMLFSERRRKDSMNYSNGVVWDKKPVYDLPEYYQTFKGKCTHCGTCCKRAGKSSGFPEPTDKNGACIHHVDNRCAIYDERPLMCRIDDSFLLVSHNYKDKRWFVKATIDRCNEMMEEDGIDKKFRIKQWDEMTEKEKKEWEKQNK